VPPWQQSYPWLEIAFTQTGAGGKVAREEWRWRIEDDLKAPLNYQERSDGTATVWCGLSRHDFHHQPTPIELLHGLADAYRAELQRRGRDYPPATVATSDGPVEISWAARNSLLEQIRAKEGAEGVIHAFETAGASLPVTLERRGKIIAFDAIWMMAEKAGGYEAIDPQLRELADALRGEIASGRADQQEPDPP
jgi:hypothetical protein